MVTFNALWKEICYQTLYTIHWSGVLEKHLCRYLVLPLLLPAARWQTTGVDCLMSNPPLVSLARPIYGSGDYSPARSQQHTSYSTDVSKIFTDIPFVFLSDCTTYQASAGVLKSKDCLGSTFRIKAPLARRLTMWSKIRSAWSRSSSECVRHQVALPGSSWSWNHSDIDKYKFDAFSSWFACSIRPFSIVSDICIAGLADKLRSISFDLAASIFLLLFERVRAGVGRKYGKEKDKSG